MDPNTTTAPVALIIEDDPSIGMLLEFLLEREGYTPRLIAEGRSAKNAIESSAAPALILLDIMLPYVDGIELLQQIRQKAGWERCAVIMLTTNPERSSPARGGAPMPGVARGAPSPCEGASNCVPSRATAGRSLCSDSTLGIPSGWKVMHKKTGRSRFFAHPNPA